MAKAGKRIGRPGATIDDSLEGRAPTARWGPKGLRRTTGSQSTGAIPTDEPVGPRRSKVEPALWGRRHLGSTPSHQGVCGRHGGEDASVTQGGLVSSNGEVWLE
jgi:hypothetical protein